MRGINRRLQRLDRAIAKATQPDPRAELRSQLDKLRNVSVEELAVRYRALLDSAQQSPRTGMSCEDLLRQYKSLLERTW